MLFDDLFGLRRYPVWKSHLEFHYHVPTLGWILGEGQAFAPESLDGAWFDDVVTGQRDHPILHGGNVDRAATQGLLKTDSGSVNDVGAVPLEMRVPLVFEHECNVSWNVLRGLVALLGEGDFGPFFPASLDDNIEDLVFCPH